MELGFETIRTGAKMFHFIAYLPLQHQLFGEQHGLVTKGFSHLHASGRIPGTAWTFNTWPKTKQLQELKVSTAATQKNSKMPKIGLTLFGSQSQNNKINFFKKGMTESNYHLEEKRRKNPSNYIHIFQPLLTA